MKMFRFFIAVVVFVFSMSEAKEKAKGRGLEENYKNTKSISSLLEPKEDSIESQKKLIKKDIPKKMESKLDIPIIIEEKKELRVIEDYNEKLKLLHSLRRDVFNLKQELGSDFAPSVPYGSDIDIEYTGAKAFNTMAQIYNDAKDKSGFFVGLNFGVVDIYTSGCFDLHTQSFINSITGKQEDKLTCEDKVTHVKPFVFGGTGGYQRFFNHYFGARLTGGLLSTFLVDTREYNLNNGTYIDSKKNVGDEFNIQSYYALAFMSADLLLELPLDYKFSHYAGAFAGINIGIMYYRPYTIKRDTGKIPYRIYPADYIWDYNLQVDYSLSLGFSVALFNKNRFEVALFLPLAFLELPGFKKAGSNMASGSESDVRVNPQSSQPFDGTPQKPDFWRGSVLSISYKRVVF